MGTRGLLGHILKHKKALRKASYNHYDSYASALGVELAKFINGLSKEQIEQMIEMVAKIEWVDDTSNAPAPMDVQDRYMKFSDLGVAGQRSSDWYCLLRHVQGAAALPHILDGSLIHQVDATTFEDDTLFCEWTYFVDWEDRMVHVRGWGNEKSVSFADVSPEWMMSFQQEAKEEE